MDKITQVKQAVHIIGGANNSTGFSEPTKLPCHSYSISAEFCKTGNKLAKIPGTPCHDCYALREPQRGGGWYMIPRVKKAMTRRLLALLHNPRWTDAMIFLFKRYNFPYFRWHDSGDLQSVAHLAKLCHIARENPNTKFWLPTQEWEIVRKYVEVFAQTIPSNLIIRLSARKIDGPTPDDLARRLGVQVSRVSSGKFDCPASLQHHKCMDCRRCWNPKIFNITYKLH